HDYSVTNTDASATNPTATPIGGTLVVYRYADPSVTSNVNLGNAHVGGSFASSAALTIANNAANDNFSEKLNASFGTLTGGVPTTSGTISLLGPTAGDNTSLTVNASTATAGAISGTAHVQLVSDGNGTSGLGQTNLPDQIVNVTGAVYRYADPVVAS